MSYQIVSRKRSEKVAKLSNFLPLQEMLCGFPLAEERKKQKTSFSHMVASLGIGVWGVSGCVAFVRFKFLFCHLPLPDMPHPPLCEVLVDSSLATFLCHCKTTKYSIRVRLCGSAWHGFQQCVRKAVVSICTAPITLPRYRGCFT